jgi:hypothetical protein
MGSVSQIGWEWYARLVCCAPTTLVTHIRNREPLTKAGAPLPYSEEGRCRAEQRYAWDTKIEQALRLYHHILADGHGVEVA